MSIEDLSDDELVKELSRRKVIKKAQAWEKIEKIQSDLLSVLYDAGMLDMKWASTDQNLEDDVTDFFDSLRGACGGNDIAEILKLK